MAYGMQVYPASGSVLRMDTTDRVVRYVAYYTGVLTSASPTTNVTISGLDVDGGEWGIAIRTTNYLTYEATLGNVFVEFDDSPFDSPSSITYRIYVFRI